MRRHLKAMAGMAISLALMTGNVGEAYSAYGPDAGVSARRLVERETASAPIGLVLFCMSQPRHCRGGGAAQVRLSAEIVSTLQRVNNSVNRKIRPRAERGDVWSVNVAAGDCEDYVLTKRAKLIAAGLPASALRLATARIRGGEGHAVLVVRTDKGDFVLDNLSPEVKEWSRTGLRWVAMSGSSPLTWRKI